MAKDTWDLKRPGKSKEFWVWTMVVLILILALAGVLAAEYGPEVDARRINNARRWSTIGIWGLSIAWAGSFIWLSRFAGKATRNPFYFDNLEWHLYRQSYAMAQYALQRGKTPTDASLKAIADATPLYRKNPEEVWPENIAKALGAAHKSLTALVRPARPKTLVLLSFGDDEPAEKNTDSQGPLWPWLGSVRLIRMMIVLVTVLIPVFVGLGLSIGTNLGSSPDATLFSGDIFEQAGTAVYLIVASALGAAFAALFKAFRYIGDLSYDEQYESSYWMRFVQGVIAGLILAILLSQAFFAQQDSAGAAFRITTPLLALVGGFSSDLVYRILKRVIDAIETLVKGSLAERIEVERVMAESRLAKQAIEANQQLGADLLDIRTRLPEEAADARKRIDQILARLLESDWVPAQE